MTTAVDSALEVRELYRRLEQARGRAWDVNDLMVGLVGDVGDLAQLIGAFRGVRPGPEDLAGAIGHELADILWSVFVLADELGVDMSAVYSASMQQLAARVRDRVEALGA